MQHSNHAELKKQSQKIAESSQLSIRWENVWTDANSEALSSLARLSQTAPKLLVLSQLRDEQESLPHEEQASSAPSASQDNQKPVEQSPAQTDHEPSDENNILTTLNDDCLREIFESAELNGKDLRSIAYVCKRFRHIAKPIFRLKHFNGKEIFENFKLWQVDAFFQLFGEPITSIDLSEIKDAQTDIVVRIMLEHCKKVTNLRCEVYNEKTILALRPLMQNLQQITIKCETDNFAEAFDLNIAYPLRKLILKPLDYVRLPAQNFPHLTELYLEAYDKLSQIENYDFFALNPQLTALKIIFCFINRGGVDCILKHLPNLQEFEVETLCVYSNEPEDFLCFGQLKHLRSLRLGSSAHENMGALILKILHDNQVPLEKLKIDFHAPYTEEIIDAICRMKSITQLEVINDDLVNDNCLMRFVQELEHLIHIHIDKTESINGVCDALKNRENLKRAIIVVDTNFSEGVTVLDERVLNEIDTIRKEKNLELDLQLKVHRGNMDAVTVVGVSVHYHSFDVLNFWGKSNFVAFFHLNRAILLRRFLTGIGACFQLIPVQRSGKSRLHLLFGIPNTISNALFQHLNSIR